MTQSITAALAAAAVFLTAVALPAQESTKARHSLTEDMWALQFGINQNLMLGPFSGGTISAKHQRADGKALRYGLTLAGLHMRGRAGTPDKTNVAFHLGADFLRYPTLARDPAGDLHMFWGAGPKVGYRSYRLMHGDDTLHEMSLGAGGTIGAEWFVRPRISLTSEYTTSLMAFFLLDPAPDEWGIGLGNSVRFGVSLYFR
jgi:hypothetical protein